MIYYDTRNDSLGAESGCFDLSHAVGVGLRHRLWFGQTAGTQTRDQKIVTFWQS